MRLVASDHAARWIFIALAGLLALAYLHAVDVAIDLAALLPKALAAATAGLAALLFHLLGQVPAYRPILRVPIDLMLSLLQAFTAINVFLPISYIGAHLGASFPLLDAELARIDAALFGFDWDATAAWVAARPGLERLLALAYASLPHQALALLLLGSLLRRDARNGEFIWIFLISMSLTTLVFILTPALGKVGHVGTGYLEVLRDIRSGGWAEFTYARSEGIVTFPSFHTTLGVVFVYVAARLQPWLLLVFLPLNLLMLLSIPPIGGHYLIDLPGGVAVALVSILAARRVGAWTARLPPPAIGATFRPSAAQDVREPLA